MSKISKQLKDLRNNPLFEDKKGFDYSSTSKTKKIDPLYQSTIPEINQTFLIYSSSNRSPNNIELIVPQATNPLISRTSDKIKKEISSFKNTIEASERKSFSSDGFGKRNQNEGYKNRPMLNLNRMNLDFSAKDIVMSSPTKKNVIGGSLFKDKLNEKRLEENRKYFSVAGNKNGMYKSTMNMTGKIGMMNKQQPLINRKMVSHDEMFHNAFMREMSAFKDKKIMEWKQL